jgi:hypothetical protein
MCVIEASENAKCLPAWSFYTPATRDLALPSPATVAMVIGKDGVPRGSSFPLSGALGVLPVEQKNGSPLT